VLVTGATGLIGRALAQRLVGSGVEVVAAVRSQVAAVQAQQLGAQPRRADIGERATLRGIAAGAEIVFHCAAQVRTAPEHVFRRLNVESVLWLLDEAVRSGARRFVFVSSVAVYGSQAPAGADGLPETAPLRARSLYGRSKICAEQLLAAAQASGRIETVALRPCIVYGHGDRHFLPRVRAALRLPVLPLPDGGRPLVDLVHADDVAAALWLAATVPHAAGRAYNITSGEHHSLAGILRAIARAEGRRPLFVPVPSQPLVPAIRPVLAVAHRVARVVSPAYADMLDPRLLEGALIDQHFDISRARTELGYTPQITLEHGLPALCGHGPQRR
jgi:nucleoside-diphosphate-sugar epimerase